MERLTRRLGILIGGAILLLLVVLGSAVVVVTRQTAAYRAARRLHDLGYRAAIKDGRRGFRVTAITDTEIVYNQGRVATDLAGNVIRNPRVKRTGNQNLPAEFVVGRRWSTRFEESWQNGDRNQVQLSFRITGREKITVPAGTFDAFVVEYEGWSRADSHKPVNQISGKAWYAPDKVRWEIAREHMVRNQRKIRQANRSELVEYERSVDLGVRHEVADVAGLEAGVERAAPVGQRDLALPALGKRAEALEHERTALKESIRAMEQVLGGVGHELKSSGAGRCDEDVGGDPRREGLGLAHVLGGGVSRGVAGRSTCVLTGRWCRPACESW